MVIAYVGAGGKTTLLKRHAQAFRKQGLKVFGTTSTLMFIEEDTLLSDDPEIIRNRLEETGYAMAGLRRGEKIAPLSEVVYNEICRHADVVLVEADGSRHMPVKLPREGEPVIYDNVDEIIVVCGLRALGRPAREVCQRLELVKDFLDIEDETILTAGHICRMVMEGYVHPLRRKYPDKRIRVHPVHDDSPEQIALAARLQV